MNSELISAKLKLYQELCAANVHGMLSDLESSVLQLLELDVHVRDWKKGIDRV